MNSSLSADVFDALHELVRLFRARMRKSMESVHPELTFNEIRVLVHTGRRPGLTQKDMVEHSHADKAQMARTLAQLEEKGWLLRTASESDKRVRCLQLSAQGQALYVQLRQLRDKVARDLLQDCPESQQAQLLALLQLAGDGAQRRDKQLQQP
ncbi:MarR family winged helix-turn-helix transcriptional regulator [Comamonas sp.]|uniref:MarR family winged helix-turn-helix transcriptional regulator n=1 Tax=Comamonas sp. TaxID=34028 RepID=UPI003A8C9605